MSPFRRPGRPSSARFVFVCAPILMLAAMEAQAQTATLSGVVRDPDQSVVGGATVTLVDGSGKTVQSTLTAATGTYTFSGVASGTYQLMVRKDGFSNVTVSSLNIAAGRSMSQDVALALGNANTTVTVSGNVLGTAENGYFVDRMQTGVMGNAPIVNLPYTVTVLPSEEIANTQARSLRDAIKYLPLVAFQEQQGDQILRPETRGIQGSVAQNTRMDGLAIDITGANAMEQYDQLEVENGLGASMYGPANPSGMFNFVLKRPTDERTNNISLDYDNKTIGTVYGDFGGRLGPHKIFGYRSNLLIGEGASYVDGSFLRRRLAEFAFDVKPTDRTTLDAHYSVYDIVERGYPGWFTYGLNNAAAKVNGVTPTFILPAAPDPTVVGFGQRYAGVNLTTQSASARVLHDFSPDWHAMAGGLWQNVERFISTGVNNITSNTGNYSTSLADSFAPRFGIASDLGYITGTVRKWGITQDVVVGSEGYSLVQYSNGTLPPAANLTLGTASFAAPRVYPFPVHGIYQNSNEYQSAVMHQQGFNLGDMLTLPRHFIVRLAASQDWIGVDNNTYPGQVRASGSNKNGISPSASVLYKPTAATTFYGTFASSLQQGDVAPGGAVNKNQALAPYRSKEWEVGFKSQAAGINLTTDLFRIQRPFANTNAANVFEITGLQVNYGAEIQAQGTLFHRWLVDGGFQALNPRLNDTGIAATNGKRFVGTPDYKTNVLSEYRLPKLANLVVTGNWQFVGRRPQDDANLHYTDGYNTFDFGLRYEERIFGKASIWRVTANNVTNEHYYSTIGPGDITGTNASSNTAFLGLPRVYAASVQFGF
ncbi:TonB-dependent receptor [Acidipila sp. EB88]|uniref:TonB-dependent receptor n=1 Tax=Acidipila sp. EB88 TaxID=2305226 RepID=UPI000F600EBA|nr:TonB-dependent receptor [Acidipila sp. EB88]RRA48351.1 TonB-dependent receptor [Acidipila sp. EB88]